MATDEFAQVVLGAAIADGMQKVADSITTALMDIEEQLRELEQFEPTS